MFCQYVGCRKATIPCKKILSSCNVCQIIWKNICLHIVSKCWYKPDINARYFYFSSLTFLSFSLSSFSLSLPLPLSSLSLCLFSLSQLHFNCILNSQCLSQRKGWFQGEAECFTEGDWCFVNDERQLDSLLSIVFPDLGWGEEANQNGEWVDQLP
jgi:hypothetical protein